MPPTTPKPRSGLPGAVPGATQAKRRPISPDALLLLKVGACFLVTGILAILLIDFAFGGITRHGPQTNGGWSMLVLALACLPLGLLLLLLGGAKWLGRPR